MDLELSRKVLIVTGGEGGIGEAIVKGIAAENGIPVIIGRSRLNGQYLERSLQEQGKECLFIETELTDPSQCQRAVELAVESYGRIDVLINNAGVNDKIGLEAGSVSQFTESLKANLIHYFVMTKLALPFLKVSSGNIINISSKTAFTGQGGTSGYVASKAAQLGLTREWAVEFLPYHIRVNAVIPAEVMTPMYMKWIKTFDDPKQKLQSISDRVPLQNRMTEQREIADTVLFLASNRASHITGQFVHVDGGYVHLDRSVHSFQPNSSNQPNSSKNNSSSVLSTE